MQLQQKKTESHLAARDQLRVGQIPHMSRDAYTQCRQPARSAKLQPYL